MTDAFGLFLEANISGVRPYLSLSSSFAPAFRALCTISGVLFETSSKKSSAKSRGAQEKGDKKRQCELLHGHSAVNRIRPPFYLFPLFVTSAAIPGVTFSLLRRLW